jgi:hypothetical protein
LIPANSKVLLVGDAEFGEVEVQKLLQKWHWKYVLRQKGRYLLKQNGRCSFQRLDSLVKKIPGCWLPIWRVLKLPSKLIVVGCGSKRLSVI